ncbi:MAG TPA: IS91 family transposase [Bryobacteraceae bacterium]|jgi:predicted Zn-ribbon and HTH transcriptional regulator
MNPRPALELAGIFRHSGPSYRARHRLPVEHLRVMRAIETCRTATLGGHVERCSQCAFERIAYNSCRNRHCPKCQTLAKEQWLEARKRDLLPIAYFHLVFTIPPAIAAIALQNKKALFQILFRASAGTLLTIAADPRHLGAEVGFFSILHTWGQNLLFHPHIHAVVTGGGLSPEGRWISSRANFLVSVRVLSRLFRRLFLAALEKAYRDDELHFHGSLESIRDPQSFAAHVEPTRHCEWVVYAKPPFGGPEQVIEYLGRYTHRVAISNQRLEAFSDGQVTFQYKDYRSSEPQRSRSMTLSEDEFIRRFLLHILPPGFQRIRHYGLLSNRFRARNLARCRELLLGARSELLPDPDQLETIGPALVEPAARCPRCQSGVMVRVSELAPLRWPAAAVLDNS